MSAYTDILDTVIETEEFITAEDYLHLRNTGELGKRKVRIVSANLETGTMGGFMVELETPRYRTIQELEKLRAVEYGR